MANSKYEYVRSFEKDNKLLPNTWIVIRLDGRGFHKFSNDHCFEKPNDIRALNLMNDAASSVLRTFSDIILAYGNSDEYSFVFKKNSQLYGRRESKLISIIVSIFTSNYVFLWPTHFIDTVLIYPPSFDARAIVYPSVQNLRDYLSWRQVDCHINNLYNTTFWALVQKGNVSITNAEKKLMGTLSKDKHELLFSCFGINYNNEHEMFKKGSIILRNKTGESKSEINVFYIDIIGDQFWKDHPSLLN